MRVVALLFAVVASMLVVPAAVRASWFDRFDLPGVGTGMPCDSFALDINSIITSGLGSSTGQKATVHDFTLLRTVDSYSPQLMGAVAVGATFPTAEINLYSTAKSSTIPYLTYDFEDLLASSSSQATHWGRASAR